MKIIADTNVLVRAMIGDDEEQSALAQAELAGAELVAVALPSLCELVWVLSQGYKIAADEIADAVRRLINAANVVVNRPAVEAGLALLEEEIIRRSRIVALTFPGIENSLGSTVIT